MIWVEQAATRKLPKPIRKLYEDFGARAPKGGRYGCPSNFNRLTMSWYLNDSKHPNTRCDNNYDFITLRPIKEGEELTFDYSASIHGGRPVTGGPHSRSRRRS
jgi:SET domain-containing protein